MSFFGGGGSGVSKKEYTVTSADLLNAIVIPEFECMWADFSVRTDALFDGVIDVFAKQANGVTVDWFPIMPPGPNEERIENVAGINLFSNFTNDGTQPDIPFKLSLVITTKATQGTCRLKVLYI